MKAAVKVSEADFQVQVIELAELRGWFVNHTRRSIVRDGRWATATSVVGFPDLFAWSAKFGLSFAAELKSERGRLSSEQVGVLESLEAAGVRVFVWRPSDWSEIEAVLRGEMW